MSKNSAVVLSVTLSVAALVISGVVAGLILCKKMYEKNYFSVNRTDVFC